MLFLAKVYVSLKPTVNDPQGETVLGALKNLGFTGAARVRVGKYLALSLEAPSRNAAQAELQQMCQKLLANPVIEQYSFDLEEDSPAESPSSQPPSSPVPQSP